MTTVFILKTSILLFFHFHFFGYKQILWIRQSNYQAQVYQLEWNFQKVWKSLKFVCWLLGGQSVVSSARKKCDVTLGRMFAVRPFPLPPPSLFLIFLFFPTGFWRDIRNKGKRGIERESVRIKCVALKKIIAFSHDFVCKLKKGGKKQTRKCAPVLIFFFWVF
jgi:hypothetical protein